MVSLLRNIDAFCARLNAGLAAVAVVLSILVAAELTVRFPDLYQQAVEAESETFLANTASPTVGF
jgi:hypothetical protein